MPCRQTGNPDVRDLPQRGKKVDRDKCRERERWRKSDSQSEETLRWEPEEKLRELGRETLRGT